MNLLLIFSLLAATAFPSKATNAAWMSPQSFQLKIGMTRSDAQTRLSESRWKLKKGKVTDEVVVEIESNKTLTLQFRKGKLDSARFEYVAFLQDVKAAFSEREVTLKTDHGEPKRPGGPAKILIFEKSNPNVHVVLSTDKSTSYGKQGLGFLVVRYFAPPAV